jgi:DNA-binding IclR family transcriptional regulator
MLASVTRTGRLLSLFTAKSPTQGVSEIALALGVSKSSARALAHSLEGIGLLRQGADRRHRLGWRIVQLHRSLLDASDLHDAAGPVLRAAYRRTGCPVAVVVSAGERADVLLTKGGIVAPSAAAAAMVTGMPTGVNGPAGVAPVRNHEGAVVGVVDVAAGPAGVLVSP